MKRITILHSMMEDTRRRFFDALHPLEPAADLAGAECGLQGLGEESFDALTRATVKRIAEEAGVGPAAAVMARQKELLQQRQEALLEKIRQERAAWRSAGEAASVAGWGFDWRRLLVCLLMAAFLSLCVRLVWDAARWEVFALLGVAGALAGLSPLRLVPRVKANLVELAELSGHAIACARVGWGGLRLARLEPEAEAWNVLVAAADGWQQAGVGAVMGRFRHQYQRGVAAVKLGNE
jgi:hypothetical protein